MISPVHLRDHIGTCPLEQMQCTTPGCDEVVRREQLHIHVNGQKHQTLVREAASRDVRKGHTDVATALAQVLATSSTKVHSNLYVPYNASTIKAMRSNHAVSRAVAVNQRLRLTQAAMSNQELSMRSNAVLKADLARVIELDTQIAALQGQLNQAIAHDAHTGTYRHAAAVADRHAFERDSRRPSVANRRPSVMFGLTEAPEQQLVDQSRSRALHEQQSRGLTPSVAIPSVAHSSMFTRNDSVSRRNNMSTLGGSVNTLKDSARTPRDTSSTGSITPSVPRRVREWSCCEDGKGSLMQTLEEPSLADALSWAMGHEVSAQR